MTNLTYDYGSPENNNAVLLAMDNLPADIDDHLSDEQECALYREGYAAAQAFHVKVTFVPEPEDSPNAGQFRISLETPGDELIPAALREMLAGLNGPAWRNRHGLRELFGEKFKDFSAGVLDGRANQDYDFQGAMKAFGRPKHLSWLLGYLDSFEFSLIDNDAHDMGFFQWAKVLDHGIRGAYALGARVWRPDGKPSELAQVYKKVCGIADGIRKRYADLILMEDAVYNWLGEKHAEVIWDLQRSYAQAVSWANDTVDAFDFEDDDLCDECRAKQAQAVAAE